jgi:hypothetical protein
MLRALVRRLCRAGDQDRVKVAGERRSAGQDFRRWLITACHGAAAGPPQCWHQLSTLWRRSWPGAWTLIFRGAGCTSLTMIKKALRFPFPLM